MTARGTHVHHHRLRHFASRHAGVLAQMRQILRGQQLELSELLRGNRKNRPRQRLIDRDSVNNRPRQSKIAKIDRDRDYSTTVEGVGALNLRMASCSRMPTMAARGATQHHHRLRPFST